MLAALLFKFLYFCSTIISADLPTMCGDVIFYYQTTPYTPQPIRRSSPRYLANRKPSLPHPLPLKVIVTVKKCAKQCHTEQCKHYTMHGPLLLLLIWQHFAYSK
jgi:hypothetical protein